MNALELCAGAGGQALGLEMAGFGHAGLVEIDPNACATLRLNRPSWRVHETDMREFDAAHLRGVELVAGGVPCPPFSVAGRQLGANDERDMFPEAIRIVAQVRPAAVMLENVRGLMGKQFDPYRKTISAQLADLGYWSDWHLLNAAEFGVSQLRPRVVMVALQTGLEPYFNWPTPRGWPPISVGNLLGDLMEQGCWEGALNWTMAANGIAPTLVGGSKKHGGPDLGPTRAREAWAKLGVDGRGLANEPPQRDFVGMPRLTTRMCARIQGFPDSWQFAGKKTATYRQIGNAFPPPVAAAVATAIRDAIEAAALDRVQPLAA